MTFQTNVMKPAMTSKYLRIRGWLILPAISLVLGTVAFTILMITMLAAFFGLGKTGNGIVYANEIIVALMLLISVLYSAIRFFGKKKDAPYIMIFLMVLTVFLLSPLLETEFFQCCYNGYFSSQSLKVFVGAIIYAAIWIPYFLVSKRVKAIFIK